MGIELQKRKDMLEVEHTKIIKLAREVMIIREETNIFYEEPINIKVLSGLVNNWLSENIEYIKQIDKTDKEVTEIPIIISKKYQCLKDMIEKYQQEEAELVELERRENLPDYIKGLIKAGALYPDGKTVRKTLEEVASFLGENKTKYKYLVASERFFRETFVKTTGKKYGIIKAKEATTIFRSY